MDNVTKTKRSQIMSAVKSTETKIEKDFRKILWEKGYRYRKNDKKYFGKPDIVMKKNKLVIFIDSCFWHGCKKHCRIPSSRKKYWIDKIENNKKRDKRVNYYYNKNNWKIIRIWEHDLKNNTEKITRNLSKTIK